MKLFKSGRTKEGKPAVLRIERLAWPVIVGWCTGPDHAYADVQLLRDGAAWPAEVRRLPRADVDAALGAPSGQAHGFEIILPPDIWLPAASPEGWVAVQAAGQRAAVPCPSTAADGLRAWGLWLAAQPPSMVFEQSLRHWLRHLLRQDGVALLAEPAHEWLHAQLNERGLWPQPEGQAPVILEPVPLQGQVESFDATVIRGWAWAEGLAAERIELWAGGQRVPGAVIRTQRADVQRALGVADRPCLGFEVEVPGDVWRQADADGACLLQVHVEFVPLHSAPWRLERRHLVDEWGRLLSEARVLRDTGASSVDPKEHQYRVLLALEHLAASPSMALMLAPESWAFAQAQAERFGLPALLTSEAGEPPSAVNAPAFAHDQTTITVWRLLRRFNERIAPCAGQPGPCLAVLEQLLDEAGQASEASHRFTVALLPYFCGLRAYDSIRPHLSVPRLRALGQSRGAWELSLFLPELVASGDYAWAASVVESLANGAPGWLNTECIAQAAHDLQRQFAGTPVEDPQALRLADQITALVGALGWDSWSRVHDLHLIDAMVSLLGLHSELANDVAERVTACAVRVYALVPDFWLRLAQRQPDAQGWPPALRDAQGLLTQLRQALQPGARLNTEQVWRLLPSLRVLHQQHSVDAAQVMRELLLAVVPQQPADDSLAAMAAFAELAVLSQTEALRLAAHPQCPPEWLAAAPDLKARIRSVTGVPGKPRARAQSQVLTRLLAYGDDATLALPPPGACQVLMRAEDGHAGLYLLALRWCLASATLGSAAGSHQLSELREAWIGCESRTYEQRHKPVALLNAYTLLQRKLASAHDDELARLLSECQARLGPWAAKLLPPPAPLRQLQCEHPALNTLVVIYSCRRNLSSRVAQIRATWAQDLTRRRIPWLIAVGDGENRIEPDQVLGLRVSDTYEDLPAKTLALIHWVAAHTDFDHLIKIDDDCHLAVDAFFDESPHLTQHYLGRRLHRAEGGTDRLWHQGKSSSRRGTLAIDKSPEPSLYADGGAGYSLSRLAMVLLCEQLQTTAGARLTRSAFMEDKLVGDLLALAGVDLSSEGYETLVRRRTGPGAVPVNAYQNSFFPSRSSPTLVTHLDDATQLPGVQAASRTAALAPPRLWPTTMAPVLGGVAGTNQLELLSPVAGLVALAEAPVLVVAVARNERVLMPHFLAHYRRQGVTCFVLVDNLSDDGTREYLLQQDDVVLYSADTEYRHSHYGVAWQQAVLGAHALNKWVVLADIDEFLVYPHCEQVPLADWLQQQDASGHDALLTLMVDMYPQGDLADANFETHAPFEVARFHDTEPLVPWRLGSGCFSNGPTYLSALRHRLIPDSAPNLYTSQKVAVLRYQPWMRLSEGLHYASNVRVAPSPVWFAHFKYHAGFKAKVHAEIARKQHFNGAEEYRKYLAMVAEAGRPLAHPETSSQYQSGAPFQVG